MVINYACMLAGANVGDERLNALHHWGGCSVGDAMSYITSPLVILYHVL